MNVNVNREYKDSVFTRLFNDKEKLIELYNALEGTNYTADDTDIKITTLQDALFMGRLNDVSFTLNGRIVVVLEHQSTINENMPVRCLLYIGLIYEKVLSADNIYRKSLIKIPAPLFIVLYNGVDEFEDEKVLKLSDAFIEQGINDLELTVRVLNINKGRNKDLVNRSKTLNDYVFFISRVRENKDAGMTLEEALAEAIRYCESHDILADFLREYGSEVMSMLYVEFNMDDALRVSKEEGIEIGIEKGIEKGEQAKATKVAMNLLQEGLDVKLISKVTGLSETVIKKLQGNAVNYVNKT